MQLQVQGEFKVTLQQHIENANTPINSKTCELGTFSQLLAVAKIKNSDLISGCFISRVPMTFPELPKRKYLVACNNDIVYGVYTLAQMQQCQLTMPDVEWKVLEFLEYIEAQLLADLKQSNGYYVSSRNQPKFTSN